MFTVSHKGKSTNQELVENLDPAIQRLEAQGQWCSMGTIHVDVMTDGSPGGVYRFKVMDKQ